MKYLNILLLVFILLHTPLSAQIKPDVQRIKAEHKQMRKAKAGHESLVRLRTHLEQIEVYHNYDVIHYDLDLAFEHNAHEVSGTVTMTARSTADNLTQIELDLYNNMTVTAVGGDASSFNHVGDKVNLNLALPIGLDSLFEVSVTYSGSPQGGGLQGLSFGTHSGVPVISSLSEPYGARSWWPCKDVPEDKADSVDIRITALDSLTAVSNGVLISAVDNGDGTRTTHWRESHPITTYLVSVAITNYRYELDQHILPNGEVLPVPLWVYPEHYDYAMQNFPETKNMIAVFDTLFGIYPFPGEKYGMAEFSWGGAMEHQTVSSMGFFGRMVIIHELAHQWWGDMVTCANWGHIWINEGFATNSEGLYLEQLDGQQVLNLFMESCDWNYGQRSIFVQDTTNVWNIFHGIVYDKGAWVLHMLRHIVGNEDFFDGLAEYRNRYEYSSTTTAGFVQSMEDVSGMNLDWFFQRWIYGIGRPEYAWRWWQREREGTKELTIEIWQEQPGELFMMPVDFRLLGNDVDTVVVMWDTAAYQQMVIQIEEDLSQVTFDPGKWILKYVDQLPPPMLGDLNGDNEINVLDVILLIRLVLDSEYDSWGDMNGDGTINIFDVIILINEILGHNAVVVKSDSPAKVIITSRLEKNESVLNVTFEGNIAGLQIDIDALFSEDESVTIGQDFSNMETQMQWNSDGTRILIYSLDGQTLSGNGRLLTLKGQIDANSIKVLASNAQGNNVPVELISGHAIPHEFRLEQNHPNPFNPRTNIKYSLPEAGNVSLAIYNLRGEEVARLVDGNQTAGFQSIAWDASNVASGIYIYRLQAEDFVQTKKMVLLK